MSERYEDLIKQLRTTPSRSKRQMLDKAAAAIERLEAERAWISVEDRLPEKYEEVLVFALYGRSWRPMIGWLGDFFEDKEWHVLTSQGEFYPSDVTHWMPLPEAPKEI